MNHLRMERDGMAACNEGRHSETSRRLTFLVLFSPDGRPGHWLMLLAGLWGLVAAATIGNLA